MNNKLTATSDNIKIKGHVGTWYVIDECLYQLASRPEPSKLFLLEHERYGDMVPCLIVDEYGNIILEDVMNGFDDLEEAEV